MPGPIRSMFLVRRYIFIDEETCVGCMLCKKVCPQGSVIAKDPVKRKAVVKAPSLCAGCMACVNRCPTGSIGYENKTRFNN